MQQEPSAEPTNFFEIILNFGNYFIYQYATHFRATQLIVFLGETAEEIFEVNFISDRNKTDIGFYATFTITEVGGEGNEINETVTEVSNYVKGRIDQHTRFKLIVIVVNSVC